MAYEPLHHKYRPQTFAELVGQEAITTTLVNALKQQKIAPAYLFTGARGTGKTSSARILAKSLNCLRSDRPTEQPCGQCEVCRSIADGSALDVIEIDAASNTGVDNIRELIERSQFAPVQCRYKVYVVDECHMLSTAAFNALLKTLEEPPDRVIFVLATTDPQRVLPTIISRCQRFDFRRIDLPAMVSHLSQIAQAEAITITPEAVQIVAQIAQGGLRDAQSMLDQLSLLEGTISVERVWDLVGAVPERDLLDLVQALMQADPTTVIDRVRHLLDRGREPLIVLQNLASFYRDLLIAKTTPDRQDLVALTAPTWQAMVDLAQSIEFATLLHGQQHLRASEVQIKNTTQPRLWLEVTLLGLLPGSAASPPSNQPRSLTAPSFSQVVPTPQATPQLPPNPKTDQAQVKAAPTTAFTAAETGAPIPVDTTSPAPEYCPVPDATTSDLPTLPTSPALPTSSLTAAIDDSASLSPPENDSPTAPVDPDPNASLPPVSIDLEQVWQTILGLIHPPGTQALFKQQGRLLALDANLVRVGITSQPLFKMAQQRITNLEAAFSQHMQQPMKVSLEVTAIPAPAAPNISDADFAADRPEPVHPTPTAPPPFTANGNQARSVAGSQPPGSQPPGSSPAGSLPAGSLPSRPEAGIPAPPEQVSATPTNHLARPITNGAPPLAPPPIEPSPGWQAEDEVSRAAKSLAQLFNGQVVSWEESPLTASTTETEFDRTRSDLNSNLVEDGDPDDDVPF
ncbi:MAG: DNA polymerase III subunit gamma/tau [Elainella sp. Prado103]|jgi:DNA polymerase-3 subunit gamma/tau|nr:DNA polymerase III subunit gamma/tau [Elainella sp. Prado103]